MIIGYHTDYFKKMCIWIHPNDLTQGQRAENRPNQYKTSVSKAHITQMPHQQVQSEDSSMSTNFTLFFLHILATVC